VDDGSAFSGWLSAFVAGAVEYGSRIGAGDAGCLDYEVARRSVMNFLEMVIKKPWSAGAICLFWMPVGGGVLALVYLGIRYWWISLGAFVLVCMVAGTQRDERQSKAQVANENFINESTARNNELIRLLCQIGKPTWGDGGHYSHEDEARWELYLAKKAEYDAWWKKTCDEVIELEGYSMGDEEIQRHLYGGE
jgi:hypothetical protein